MAEDTPRKLLLPGSSNADLMAVILEEREIRVNLDTGHVHVGDGVTLGGQAFVSVADFDALGEAQLDAIEGWYNAFPQAVRVIADYGARGNIPADERYIGMTVYVVSDQRWFVLNGGITNDDWTVPPWLVPLQQGTLAERNNRIGGYAPDWPLRGMRFLQTDVFPNVLWEYRLVGDRSGLTANSPLLTESMWITIPQANDFANIKISSLKAEALSDDANPSVRISALLHGVAPSGFIASWGGYSTSFASLPFVTPDWDAQDKVLVIGDSMMDGKWCESVAAELGLEVTNVAVYSSGAKQKYRLGTAKLYFTLASGAIPASGGSTTITSINGEAPGYYTGDEAYLNLSAARSFMNTSSGDTLTAHTTLDMQMAGRHVRVSVPNMGTPTYTLTAIDDIATSTAVAAQTLAVPDNFAKLKTHEIWIRLSQNYFYAQVFPEGVNTAVFDDIQAIVDQTEGNRVIIMGLTTQMSWLADGGNGGVAPTPKAAMTYFNAQVKARWPNLALNIPGIGNNLEYILAQQAAAAISGDASYTAAGIIGPSRMADDIHFNTTGQANEGAALKAFRLVQTKPPALYVGASVQLTVNGSYTNIGNYPGYASYQTTLSDAATALVQAGGSAFDAEAREGVADLNETVVREGDPVTALVETPSAKIMTVGERSRLSDIDQNLSAQTTAGRTATPVVGGSALGGRTSAINAPRAVRERLFRLEVMIRAAGTIKVNRQTRSGTTMTVVESIDVPVVAGLNTLTETQLGANFWFNAGDYLGFDHPNGVLDATSTSTDAVGYYTAVGSLTAYDAASPNAGRIEARGFFTSQAVTKSSQDALSSRVDANANSVALVSAITARGLGDSTRLGRQNDPVAATANTSRTYYVPGSGRANDGYLSELSVWANAAGSIGIKVGVSDGTNINQVSTKTVTVAAGLNVLTPANFGVIAVAASAFVGVYTPSGVVGITATSTDSVGYYTAVGDVTSVPLSSLTTPRLEIAFRVQQYGASTQDTPLARWKRYYRGLDQPPKLMASPPTLTIGAADAVSAITGAANASVNVGRDDARLTKVGAVFTDTLSVYKNAAYSGARIRFKLADSRFEMRLLTGNVGRGVSVKVDGEYIRTDPWPPGMLESTNHLVLVNFGTNVLTYTGIDVSSIGNGGSGYVLGEIITLAGGTFTVPMRIIVTKVASGVITGAKIYDPGNYTAVPAHNTNMAQASTSGTGTGAQIRPIWTKRLSTKKMHEVELTLDAGTRFGGLNISPNATLLPWPEQSVYGRWMIVGDSYTSYAQCDHPDANFAAQLVYKLGVHDAYWRVGYSGIGWVVGGPTSVGIDDLTSYVTGNTPDVVVVFMGGNDESSSSPAASVQAKVTSWGNAVHAALPNVKLVIVPAWTCGAAINSAIIAGAAAITDQARVRSIDIRTRDIYTNDGTGEDFRSTDDNHPGQPGHDYLAQAVTSLVAAAVQEMA